RGTRGSADARRPACVRFLSLPARGDIGQAGAQRHVHRTEQVEGGRRVSAAGEVSAEVTVRCTVNGTPVEARVEARRLLADFLREELDLTGTHVGCEHGVCGACTVLLDGEPARACLLFAAQVDGCSITTIEGLTPPGGLSRLQAAF